MRFVQKGQSPDFFEQEKIHVPLNQTSKWNEFQNPCKGKLTEHLIEEQEGLCIYCECDLSSPVTGSTIARKRHIEHLAPQGSNEDLRFAYHNLTVSCDGQLLSRSRVKEGESCGHRKDDEYDEAWFINPTVDQNVTQFFTFESEDGSMLPAETDRHDHAETMIEKLNLDAQYLKAARLNAKEVMLEHLNSLEPEESEESLIFLDHELSQPREFISFLQSAFN